MKHTPGPWKYDGECFILANYRMVAEIRGFGAGLPQDANAHLIAAAPELLEACKKAVLTLEWIGEREATNITRGIIRKAISKAEGKS